MEPDPVANSVSVSIFQSHTTTSTLYGTATDITGNNVYLSAGGNTSTTGDIGVSNGTLTVSLPLSSSLSDATKVAIAAAEPEDITFYDAGGQAITNVFPVLNAAGSGYAVGDLLTVSGGSGMELQVTALGTNNAVAAFNVVSLGSGYTAANGGATAGGKGTGCTVNVSDTPVSLTVNEVKSVDIATTTGTVIFNATGNVNVGTLGGFNLESVNAGGEARIQAQSGLVDVRGDTNPVIVAGGNAILEGGNNGIGTSSVPIYVALSTGSLSASAANDIYITATEYDLRLVDIYSNANVYLTADGTGSIFDDNPNSAAAGVWKSAASRHSSRQGGASVQAVITSRPTLARAGKSRLPLGRTSTCTRYLAT